MSDGLVSLTVDVWDGSNPHQEVPPNWHFVEIQAFDKVCFVPSPLAL
tara:strand:+ start:172 stop:312 length:141 start_codon:yes stop_codon:yes gene_type:complete